jgi:hypothetical protein
LNSAASNRFPSPDALRDEIRYRLELYPCTTVNDDCVELNGVSAP